MKKTDDSRKKDLNNSVSEKETDPRYDVDISKEIGNIVGVLIVKIQKHDVHTPDCDYNRRLQDDCWPY